MNQTELGRALPSLDVAAAIRTCVTAKCGTKCLSVSLRLVCVAIKGRERERKLSGSCNRDMFL